ncbi:MAG TPA: 4-hydroxy-3-methylbut-2-en-1-yl diphosphate synthase [Clostridiales bacterium]|nr:flavodoxin-dependent (E)-4-hydroxy-3-methylbut-2-enyl-diphosphate synthase [Eubacteriales bacterium]HBR31517.1 4-hydroxy-3-methylbut-2-en-1-yl diphosphate synthase [Clostridiales bacterium]
MYRRKSRVVKIGGIEIGGENRISVQSMTNTPTSDRDATLKQIKRLEKAGCDIVRFTVNSMDAVRNIAYFRENTNIPLVADIHFDYRLAIESAAAGISKIRINPGNIGSDDRMKSVALECARRGIPIRIGINSGSLEEEVLKKYGSPTPQALFESAILSAKKLERFDFYDIVLSVKSSDVSAMIQANRLIANNSDYPLHLGVTETGTAAHGIVKSSIGIGSLLADGIGDTIRVSLTDDPVTEVRAANDILQALKLKNGINLISCPTCGRTQIELITIANRLQDEIDKISCDKQLNVALMGCVVNGPGEAREADVGVAGGRGEAVLFRKGEIIRKIAEDEIVKVLVNEIKELI